LFATLDVNVGPYTNH